MAGIRALELSFAGGEISPEMLGRIDDSKYQTGLAKCQNFIVRPQGPVENRGGLRFVREAKYPDRRARLIPFMFSASQTMAVEAGHLYFRFHTDGATLLGADGAPYEIASPYIDADLMGLRYVQKEDVLTLVHVNYPPMELRRHGAQDWRLTAISFLPEVSPPGAPTVAKNNQTGTQYQVSYVVTAMDAAGVESAASAPGWASGNLFENGASNTVSWAAASGASRYLVYKLQSGLYGYLGQTDGSLSVIDDNIAPDMSKTPPVYDAVFGASGEYPGAVTYFQQRRCFAGTLKNPQRVWMTRSGTESAMSYGTPLRDDDRIDKTVAAAQLNMILHMVPVGSLLLLTSSAEFRVSTMNSDALTPASFSVAPQSYEGASAVQPVVVNNVALYCSARGGHMRELGYSFDTQGYRTSDISLRAGHLFERTKVVDMAFSKAPVPVVWAVAEDGMLLGLTYVPEHQVGAWHRHVTDGAFESCCAVAEGDFDALYAVVRREINGQTARYVERMEPRRFDGIEDAFFVDSGISYESGEPQDEFTGLEHLEGKEVSILADGAVMPRQTVSGGAIRIGVKARKVHAGLPVVSEIETLPVAAQVDGAYGQGRRKNVSRVFLRVLRSSGVWAGPGGGALTEYKQRSDEPYGSPPALRSGEIEIIVRPSWENDGRALVRQLDPLPLSVLSIVAEVSFGG